jgi:excisionase family DNA binding protein
MTRTENPETLELLTRPQAARHAGVGLRQIRRACASGELPVYQIGGWPRVRWPEVRAWIESRRSGDSIEGAA